MSILIDENTKLIIQGITGREGTFHGERMIAYGTKVVGGVTPGKGGQNVFGIPVFDTVKQAYEETGANTTVLFVPARFTAEGAYEAIDAKIPLVITIAEHVPVHDMMKVYNLARKSDSIVVGPNSFGIISPGRPLAGAIAMPRRGRCRLICRGQISRSFARGLAGQASSMPPSRNFLPPNRTVRSIVSCCLMRKTGCQTGS